MPETFCIRNVFLAEECKRFGLPLIDSQISEHYGQLGEDLIAESLILSAMTRRSRPMSSLRYVEIGANDPLRHSSTYLFYKKYAAQGVLVEPLEAHCEDLRRVRPRDTVVNCAVSHLDSETVRFYVTRHSALSSMAPTSLLNFADAGGDITDEILVKNLHINRFLEKYAINHIDFMSIDVEGMDSLLLEHFDFARFRPTLIQVEPSSEMHAIFTRMMKAGYLAIALTMVNVFFLDAESLL